MSISKGAVSRASSNLREEGCDRTRGRKPPRITRSPTDSAVLVVDDGGRDGVAVAGLAGEQFLSEDRHVAGRFNAETNLAAVNIHDCDADVFADHNLFTELTAED